MLGNREEKCCRDQPQGGRRREKGFWAHCCCDCVSLAILPSNIFLGCADFMLARRMNPLRQLECSSVELARPHRCALPWERALTGSSEFYQSVQVSVARP